jgi:hypothetical protein
MVRAGLISDVPSDRWQAPDSAGKPIPLLELIPYAVTTALQVQMTPTA